MSENTVIPRIPSVPRRQRGALTLEILLALTVVTTGVLLTANSMLRSASLSTKASSLSQQYAEAAAMVAAEAQGATAGSGLPQASQDSTAPAIGAGVLTISDGGRRAVVTWGDGGVNPEIRVHQDPPGSLGAQPGRAVP